MSEDTSSAVCSSVNPEIWSTMEAILGSAAAIELCRLFITGSAAVFGTSEKEERATRRAQHREARAIAKKSSIDEGLGSGAGWGGWQLNGPVLVGRRERTR